MSTKSLYSGVTNDIVEMLRTTDANSFELPWTRSRLNTPSNVVTKKAYNGINRLVLWAVSLRRGYASSLFATYRQWQSLGARVRRGERAVTVIFYKSLSGLDTNAAESNPKAVRDATAPRSVARSFSVFAAEQVEGFEVEQPPEGAELPIGRDDALDTVTHFIGSTRAHIVEGGERAYYRPLTDTIHLPARSAFVGTQTLSSKEAYFGTALHELAHWSGHPTRLNRDLTQRFGTEGYAIEELIAELASAFLCVDLGVTPTPRPDHAHYLKNWLRVLQDDERAIFTAASKASQATAYLHGLQPGKGEPIYDTPDGQGAGAVSSSIGSGKSPALSSEECAPC